MYHHSKILVCYQIASQKMVLGEALAQGSSDPVSQWVSAPQEGDAGSCQGYSLALFDDGGREIGQKPVSMLTAEAFLGGLGLQEASI